MTSYLTSADGTRIAFDRVGHGPPVIVVGGLLCERKKTGDLAEQLARRDLSALNYDRRGRGESGNTLPYALAREIEDIGALVSEAGGTAAVYGHSSGAGLALQAAASGLPISGLVLHEPPYGAGDSTSKAGAIQLAEQIVSALEEGARERAIQLFFSAMGMPATMVDELANDRELLALAPTMPYDFEAMGELSGGSIPEALVRSVSNRTLVLAGSTSPEFFRDAAMRLSELLPDATYSLIEGHDHAAPGEVVAPVVARFLHRAGKAGSR